MQCKPWGGRAGILEFKKNESPRSEGVSAGTGEGVVVDAVLGLAFDFPPSPESGLRKTGSTSRTQFVGRARGFYK